MAHGLSEMELAQTVAERREGSRSADVRTPLAISEAQFSAISPCDSSSSATGAELAQTDADWRSLGAVRQCASYPPKGGLTGREPAQPHAPVPDWRKVWEDQQAYYTGPVDADLSETNWADSLPAILRDAQEHFAGQADIEVMRDHYRCADRPTRALIASIMGAR